MVAGKEFSEKYGNEKVEKYNSGTPHEKRDLRKYKKENLIWEWGLNAMLSKLMNRKQSEENA